MGGFCGNYKGHGDLAALPCGGCSYCSRALMSFNAQLDEALDGLGGTDPLGSFQRASRGGRSVHPVPPRDASFGRGAS